MYKNNKLKAKKLYKKYKHILKDITFIGITGTNGKTTTTTLLYKYLMFNNIKATLIGTNGIYINNDYYETINTTPGVDKLYEIIIESYNKGIKYIIMEVSSHAILQHRVHGIKFKIKAITNITQDHLDYHKTFKKYRKTKLSFLKNSNIIVNKEIKFTKKLNNIKIYTYGEYKSYFLISNLINTNTYSSFNIKINNTSYFIKTNLLGQFNIYNVTLFISVLYVLNMFNYKTLKRFLNQVIKINGRMEQYQYKNKTIIIDYAHTPDGLEKVLSYVKDIYKEKIVTIFGCGGNRDQYKREKMGIIASKYSDYIILTNDNPRYEDELDIINDIIKGVSIDYKVIPNRKEAIDFGLSIIQNYNILLILGRGCENEIKIKDQLIKFNDVEYVKEIINE